MLTAVIDHCPRNARPPNDVKAQCSKCRKYGAFWEVHRLKKSLMLFHILCFSDVCQIFKFEISNSLHFICINNELHNVFEIYTQTYIYIYMLIDIWKYTNIVHSVNVLKGINIPKCMNWRLSSHSEYHVIIIFHKLLLLRYLRYILHTHIRLFNDCIKTSEGIRIVLYMFI